MLFGTDSDKCPNCKGPLTLLSHSVRFEKTEIHEFDFQCDKCNRKYEFKDGELVAKGHESDLIGESEGIAEEKKGRGKEWFYVVIVIGGLDAMSVRLLPFRVPDTVN